MNIIITSQSMVHMSVIDEHILKNVTIGCVRNKFHFLAHRVGILTLYFTWINARSIISSINTGLSRNWIPRRLWPYYHSFLDDIFSMYVICSNFFAQLFQLMMCLFVYPSLSWLLLLDWNNLYLQKLLKILSSHTIPSVPNWLI